MNIYLAGCGKIGYRLGERLANAHDIVGLKRNPQALSSDALSRFSQRAIDLGDANAVKQLPTDADVIVFTVTPSHYDVLGYRMVYETILDNVIDWAGRHSTCPLVLLVSSTGVYGQENGEWVNEDSPTEPLRESSRCIVAGEKRLLLGADKPLIVRCSGIYSAARTALIRRAISGDAMQKTPPIWTNRIHEDDVIGVLAMLITAYESGKTLDKIYLASDDMPVSRYDVCAYICAQMGYPTPPVLTDSISNLCNKRCDNTRLKALGYAFTYPSYREGYRDITKGD